jgi:hypothetical protein
MRRVKLVVAIVALMAAMMAAYDAPAMALNGCSDLFNTDNNCGINDCGSSFDGCSGLFNSDVCGNGFMGDLFLDLFGNCGLFGDNGLGDNSFGDNGLGDSG